MILPVNSSLRNRHITTTMIASLLDTDLYKLTMQAVIHKHFSDARVSYKFYNRSTDMRLTTEAVSWIRDQIDSWAELRFTPEEIAYLEKSLPYLPKSYLEWLPNVRLNPSEEIQMELDPDGDIEITASGLWQTAILYEIPILATVSEGYFRFVETDWNLDGQFEQAKAKSKKLLESGCFFSEFGSRRRRSLDAQTLVMKGIVEAAKENPDLPGKLIGTSNVHFARMFGLTPVGTVAHELMMGIAAYKQDYARANKIAMDVWLDTVGNGAAGVALTDTFGTQQFLKTFVKPYTDIYAGVRQDSGDPVTYTHQIGQFYRDLGYASNSKVIMYSDSLNLERCLSYKKEAEKEGLIPRFGVGTFFSNDFRRASNPSEKSKPMNIVMKISSVNEHPAIKLSDNLGKNTGDEEEVARVKRKLGYVESGNIVDESNRW